MLTLLGRVVAVPPFPRASFVAVIESLRARYPSYLSDGSIASLALFPLSIRVIRSFGICVRKRPEFLNQIPRLEERIEKEDQEEKHCFGQ